MIKTTNLGLVMAIWVGETPPTNINILWFDTSLVTPLHKFYNQTTASWEEFIYSTLIDNVTIKKNGSNQLYVDTSEIPALVIGDGSIALIKLADVPTGTVFYRKTAGDGPPETQTLSQLKTDLGLTGTNSGDQDLSGYVLKVTTINTKPLSSNIVLTPEDIGSPAGSGTSTGTNTGDETEATILAKLGLASISGINTGDQTASQVPITDLAGLFVSENVEDALAEVRELANENSGSTKTVEITLPASSTVEGRLSGAIEGVDYPTGWVLASDDKDLLITHSLSKSIAHINVFNFTDSTTKQLRLGAAAYTGVYDYDSNQIRIQSLATINSKLSIYLIFA